jgi:hypothetical protein
MNKRHQSFFALAVSRQIVTAALKVALFVGTVLALINHGASILAMSLTGENVMQIILTYFVPYCVSTYSAVKALQARAANPELAQPSDDSG